MRVILLSIILFFSHQSYSQKKFQLQQKDQTQIKINAVNDFEKLEITTSKNSKIQVIDSIETSITDKEMHVAIEDYNFDGYKDFSVYRLDDGMGVYTIYQIFIYNPTNGKFKALQIPVNCNPECDEFCDVQINPKKKTLQSSCRGGAGWHIDIWKFDKNKNLILLKK
ncbi:hypothetical protein GKZ90_0016515 [Flavobacterium sp. MC2016-06]|jgi:hypothetical protein|uniref:XAC2610-related protein n=1 Tax=Flavobacterium sp. MC2016-06 TaxID=2676308 RepID=UPI0012BAB2B8|nr:hypothetical protein [Flavobacterium sp. MC2016-06]MBU3860025.1 hypothetical protein [Flavobacterium sp. MC2016-06]